jgi:ribose transport system substrate-binding protein
MDTTTHSVSRRQLGAVRRAACLALCVFMTAPTLAVRPVAAADFDYSGLKLGIPAVLATHPFYQDQFKWIKAVAERDGWGPVTIVDANLNDLKQISDFQSLAAQGNNAFVLDFLPTAAQGLTDVVASLPAHSCVVAASATPITGAEWFIQPHREGGEAAGEAAAKWINDNQGGTASIFVGRRPDNYPIEQRAEGFKDAISRLAPNATVVAEAKAIGGTEGAGVIADALQAHPDITVIYQPDDASAIGSLAPLAEVGKAGPTDAWVGGFDGNSENLDKIAAGDNPLQFTWSNMNSLLAISIATELEKCYRGEQVSPAVRYSGVPTTADNVDMVQRINNDAFSPEAQNLLKTYLTPVDHAYKTGEQYTP